MIPMGRYGQPNPVMCDLSMVEHYIMREKKLEIHWAMFMKGVIFT